MTTHQLIQNIIIRLHQIKFTNVGRTSYIMQRMKSFHKKRWLLTYTMKTGQLGSISYLVVYHRKSLVSLVVFICSSKLEATKVLLPHIPTFSLYQLHGDDTNEVPLVINETSSGDFCEMTYIIINSGKSFTHIIIKKIPRFKDVKRNNTILYLLLKLKKEKHLILKYLKLRK